MVTYTSSSIKFQHSERIGWQAADANQEGPLLFSPLISDDYLKLRHPHIYAPICKAPAVSLVILNEVKNDGKLRILKLLRAKVSYWIIFSNI